MEVVESFGKYHLVKDSAGDHYAKEVSSGNLTKLFDSNGITTVNQANFGGQTFYGVERINGKNYIAFYTSGDSVHLWDSGNGWTKEGADNISLEKARTWFKSNDAGGVVEPNIIEVVESFGSYHLVKDSAGDHYAKEVSSGNLTKLFDSNGITTVNQANFGGQTFYGVERINGKNYIAFLLPQGTVHLWDSGNGWTKERGAEDLSLETAKSWFKADDIGGIGRPTYDITHSSNNISENDRGMPVGESLFTNISTTNVEAGTFLYFSIEGKGISKEDFSTPLSANILIQDNGKGEHLNTVVQDNLTEGNEEFVVKLFTDLERKNIVATSSPVTILDTSKSPEPTYKLSITPSALDEGDEFAISVDTTNLDQGTQLYFSIEGDVNSSDFIGKKLEGSFLIDNKGLGSFTYQTNEDKFTEGEEKAEITLYSDYKRTLPVSSKTLRIRDTSLTPAPIPTPTPEPTPAGTPPNLVKATLRGKNITLQFDNALLDTLPRIERFTLNQSNREYLIVDAEVKPQVGIVKLTVEKELDPTVSITLDYLDFAGDQTTGVVESSTGVDLESFTGFKLNNQGSQANSITIDEGEFEGNQITLFLSAPISEAVPSKSRFKVKSANKKQKILAVSTEPDDGIITLTTKKSLDLQESVLVSYRDLSGDQVDKVIEDLAGNDMATIKDFEIISGGNDSIAPTVASATLDENILSVEFDSIIRNTKISKNRFKVKINGKKVRVLSATVEQDDSYVELALKPKNLRKIDLNSSVALSYTDPKGDQTNKVVEDVFGNDLDSFSGYVVEIVKI